MRIVSGNAAYFYTRCPDGDIECVTYEKALIEITDAEWRPVDWPEFVKYFEDRPKHWPLTERDLWEFGATSMLNALISLTGEGR
jgi:hypothetical protein